MQLFFKFLYFFSRVALGALGIGLLARRFQNDNNQDPTFRLTLSIASFLLSFILLAVYDVFLYPRYRSPLRFLPTVKNQSTLRLVVETPRGKTPLRWMQEHPDADLIHALDLFGISSLFPASPAALRDVMSTNTYDFEKPWGLRSFLARIIGFGLITSEDKYHKHQRRALTPAFNIKHIRALYEPMWTSVEIFLDALSKEVKQGEDVEVGEWASRLALDIIGRAALSRDFKSLTSTDNKIAEAFLAILEPEPHMVVFFGLNLLIPPAIMKMIPLRANKILEKESTYLRHVCEDILEEKKSKSAAGEKSEADSYSILQRIIDSGEFSKDELVDQMLTFIAAGHETTGSSISWAMHLLTLPEFQHYQKILRDEVQSHLPKIRQCVAADDRSLHTVFESMPYLNGVCEEVLRLFPAVPTTLREAVRPTSIAGVPVPRDTLIVLVPWAINRNPRFWGANADKLYPERWIDRQPDGSLRPNKHGGAESNYCEITFLHGQRACIGRDFAKAELRCALAGLFGRFEVSRLPGDSGEVEITGAVTTKPRGGLRIRLTQAEGDVP